MFHEIDIATYYHTFGHLPLIDVRSPGEYEQGHIPGAHSIALFSNDERAAVGTVYKQKTKEKAIELGYKYVTPKLNDYVIQSERVAPGKEVVVHCWRGGMRSRSFAQHLLDSGFQMVYVVTGGYKAFRNHVLDSFARPFNLRILGGYTGSGKTYLLESIKEMGHQVIDLERLANHKGSSFGGINQPSQPTVEQFENNLFEAWRHLDISKPIWVEDESHSIGRVMIPMNLYHQMRKQPIIFIDIPREERARLLVRDYSACNNQLLAESIGRISKRMGGLAVQKALEQLENGNYHEVALIALHYYDKLYDKGLRFREPNSIITLKLNNTNPEINAKKLLTFLDEHERNQINTI